MNSSSLPPEILSLIFQYLSEKDVSCCARVCVKWREETNRNELWKRFCLQRQWAEIHHINDPGALSQIPPHVEPFFQVAEPSEGSSLTPLCAWYIEFLQHHYLLRNWKMGRYVVQEFDETSSEYLGDVTAMDMTLGLLALGCDNGIVSIWKQTKGGLRFLEKVCCVFTDAVISHLLLEGVCFIVLQLGVLQVYRKMSNGYSLCYVKAMIIPDVVLPDILSNWPSQRSVDEWFVENIYDHFDDSKFQYARTCHTSIIAFWGTIVGIQVLCLKHSAPVSKTLNLPYEKYTVQDVAICLHRHDSLVYCVLNFIGAHSIIVEYNLDNEVCTKHIEDASDILSIKISNNFLVSLDKSGLFSVWSCKSAQKLNVFQSDLSNHFDFEIFDNTIFYQSNSRVVSVLNCTGLIEQSELEIVLPACYLSKGMGDLLVVKRGVNIEIWSRVMRQKLYEIENILIEGLPYSVHYFVSGIVLWGFNLTPVFIWFW